MKARLIVSLDSEWPVHPETHLCLWPAEQAIPKGWEELELVFATPEPAQPVESDPADLCDCTHGRKYHVSYQHGCLVQSCDCLRFREVASV